MKTHIPHLLSTVVAVALSCQSLFADNWITPLDDDVYVSQLSIPGSHDSGTGEGFQGGLGFLGSGMAKTQDLSLSEQWDCGIRVFDLRPTVKQDGDNLTLQIYHGVIETKISFNDALQLLRDKLIENPGEFAIVIMRHESDANKSLQENWPALVSKSLTSDKIADYLVDFKPGMTIGELRGKILVMSRDEYADGPVGGYITSWSHSETYLDQIKARFRGKKSSAEAAKIQDFYEFTMEGGSEKKQATVLGLLQKTMTQNAMFWVINHTSGYTKSANSNSNRENAQNTNGAVLEFLSEEGNSGRTGIIMMDFAGVDESNGYETKGLELTRAVIAQNQRYVPKATAIGRTLDNGNVINVKERNVEAEGQIAVYATDGSKVVSGVNRVTLPAKGTYIIENNRKVRKVFVNK